MSALLGTAERRLAAIERYRAGRPAGRVAGKLSANESPLGPSPRVRAAIAQAAHAANRYETSDELRALLAVEVGVEPDRLVLAAGSDELCYLLATLFIAPGSRVVLSDPCYRIDEIVTRVHEGEAVPVPLRRDGAHDLPAMAAAAAGAAVVWLPTPHNPTGASVDPAELDHFVAAVPGDCLVVLDEAYRPYADADRRPDTGRLLAEHPNLFVQRTFSKADGLAGLRIGYGLAHPDVIAAIDAVRPPFNVNVAALAAARAALGDTAWRDYGVELVRRERARLVRALEELGVEHYDSQANFVTLRPSRPEELHRELAEHGVTVRDGADLGLEGWVRISIGGPPQMAIVRAVLADHERRFRA